MKRIIALSGPSNTGKTSSIRTAYELLIEHYPQAKVTLIPGGAQKDISAIVVINEVSIGFESQGVPGKRLPESLDLLVKKDCKIIICATRTRGSTVSIVKALEPIYAVKWLYKARSSDIAMQSKENLKAAQYIFSELSMSI